MTTTSTDAASAARLPQLHRAVDDRRRAHVTYQLEARGIVKRYGHVEVLRETDFTVEAGKVTALIGDNGAGKSTLVKILSGVMPPQGGQILLAGKPVTFSSPNHARALGIETVYQDLALAPDLRP